MATKSKNNQPDADAQRMQEILRVYRAAATVPAAPKPSTPGWWDPNPEYSVQDLLGSGGYYSQMRYAHRVIAPAMQRLRRAVAAARYIIEPSDDSITARVVAAGVKQLIEAAYGDLGSWVAETYDSVYTYGFSLHEITISESGFFLDRIPAERVSEFVLGADNVTFCGAKILGDSGDLEVPAPKLAYFGRPPIPGAYFGSSQLRPYVADHVAYMQDMQGYLRSRQYQAGFLVARETEPGITEASWEAAAQFLTRHYAGDVTPALLPYGLELTLIQGSDAGQYLSQVRGYDEAVRTGMGEQLGNLGGANGGGAYALGETLHAAATDDLSRAIKEHCQLLSGHYEDASDLFARLTAMLGADPAEYTPTIRLADLETP